MCTTVSSFTVIYNHSWSTESICDGFEVVFSSCLLFSAARPGINGVVKIDADFDIIDDEHKFKRYDDFQYLFST